MKLNIFNPAQAEIQEAQTEYLQRTTPGIAAPRCRVAMLENRPFFHVDRRF
jgi:hypothetical protein